MRRRRRAVVILIAVALLLSGGFAWHWHATYRDAEGQGAVGATPCC